MHKAIGMKNIKNLKNEYSLNFVLDYFWMKSTCCVENKEAFYPKTSNK